MRADGGLRDDSRARIVDAIRRRGSPSRGELSALTGLSRSTVSAVVADLHHRGQIVEDGAASSPGRGRPPGRLRMHRSAGAVLGLDLGHTQLRAGVADLSGAPLAEAAVPYDRTDGPATVDAAAALVEAVVTRARIEPRAVRAGAVAIPGPVLRRPVETNGLRLLPEWMRPEALDALSERVGVPLAAENDANLAAYAEHCLGAGRGHDDVVYVMAGEGIGAGLVLGGRPHRGAGGLAGELGHVRVHEEGAVCRCGNRGCLATVAAAPALLALLRPTHGADLTVRGMLELVAAGDTAACRLVQEAGTWIGRALADLCNHVNPELIVVGGELSEAEDVLLPAIREGIERNALPPAADLVRVARGRLGERAALLGAMVLTARDTERLPSALVLGT